jgi:hypothetical protein
VGRSWAGERLAGRRKTAPNRKDKTSARDAQGIASGARPTGKQGLLNIGAKPFFSNEKPLPPPLPWNTTKNSTRATENLDSFLADG